MEMKMMNDGKKSVNMSKKYQRKIYITQKYIAYCIIAYRYTSNTFYSDNIEKCWHILFVFFFNKFEVKYTELTCCCFMWMTRGKQYLSITQVIKMRI